MDTKSLALLNERKKIIFYPTNRKARAPSVQWLDCCCAYIFQKTTAFELFLCFSQCVVGGGGQGKGSDVRSSFDFLRSSSIF